MMRLVDPSLKFPAKIEQLFMMLWLRVDENGKPASRFIIKAPRGGGKTKIMGAFNFAEWFLRVRDIVVLGGSLEQARNVYGYFTEHVYAQDAILESLPDEPTMAKTETDRGNYLKAVAASPRAVRGPHPNTLAIDEACFPSGTLVHTPQGVEYIENIHAGDVVFGLDGLPQAVVATMQREYDGDLVTISPSHNPYGYTATANHPVLVVKRTLKNTAWWKSHLPETQWVRADMVEKGDAIVHPVGMNAPVVDEELEWFLGLYTAEGSTNNYGKVYISLHSDETEYVERVTRFVANRYGKNVSIYKQKGKKCVNLQFYHPELAAQLKELCGHRSENKRLPFLTRACVEGYIAGDGMEHQGKKISRRHSAKIRVHTNSQHIVHQLQRYYLNERRCCAVFKRPNGKWQLEVTEGSRSRGWFVGDFFFATVNEVSFSRKKQIVYNFETQDHTYYIPGGLVHNCEAKDEIIESALPMVTASENPLVVMTSTFHKIFGKFQEVWDGAPQMGYARFTWDVFDVTKSFDPAVWKDPQLRREIHDLSIEQAGEASLEFRAAGRTGDIEGWFDIMNVIQDWRAKSSLDWFDVELMGLRPSAVGMINKPEDVDACMFECEEPESYDDFQYLSVYPAEYQYFQELSSAGGIDWGFSGMTSVTGLHRAKDDVLVKHYQKEYTGTRSHVIIEDTLDAIERFRWRVVYCDAEAKFENADLAAAIAKRFYNSDFRCRVEEVNFGTEKNEMLGNYRSRFQRRLYRIPLISRFKPAMWQHKRYRYQEGSDKPLKQDDHIPDSTMLATKHFPLGKVASQLPPENLQTDTQRQTDTFTGGMMEMDF